jgi:hypothetical protein
MGFVKQSPIIYEVGSILNLLILIYEFDFEEQITFINLLIDVFSIKSREVFF